MSQERLQKVIAQAGLASRRHAETLITAGEVTVNGRVVTELGTKVDPKKDHVKVRGKLITRQEPLRYILLYKPRKVMTTNSDPEGRSTVIDLIRGVKERVFPVGRLDFHSEGLLLLTNDGDLANSVAHPSSGSEKIYHVKTRGLPTDAVLARLSRGISIEGKRTLPCKIRSLRRTRTSQDDGNSWFEVRLREGRTQQIRKMFRLVGHPVSKLKRIAIGPLRDDTLEPGQWRELTEDEIARLKGEPVRAAPKPSSRRPSRKGPRKSSGKPR